MDFEKEQLKLKLIETQMQVLQYQHREISASIRQAQEDEARRLAERDDADRADAASEGA